MMDERRGTRQPFTRAQREELELQALIFNYMALGIPIPSHLMLPFQRRSFSLDPFSLHPLMICDRKAAAEEDPEPWRCRRTDGKKWRCSREAFGDSKYCERHKHRGKKCVTKATEMLPLFATSSSSSVSRPSSSPPLALFSSSFLGGATRLHLENHPHCHSPVDEEEKKEKQAHCFVFGADLKLPKPVNALSEKGEAQSPKLRLGMFGGFPDANEERATQLSISIPRC